MANKIFLKKSSVAGKIPAAEDLEYGELALNYTDGNLFYKSNANAVTTLVSTQYVSVTGNVTGGNILTAGSISSTGNISGNYILGNGSQLTGIDATSIQNGTSNFAVIASGGNIQGNIGGSTVTNIYADGLQVTGLISASGNVTAGNLSGTSVTGTLLTAAQTNITSVGTLTSLGVTGNVDAGNLSGTSISGTLTTAAQPNITSVGTLGSLAVTGNVDGGNLRTAGLVSATGTVTGSQFNGSGAGLTSIPAANVTGTLSVNTTGYAATVSGAAQSNITSVGTLTSLSVTGNVTAGNLSGTSIVGTLTTAAQTNITSVGTLGSLSVTGNVTAGNLSGTAITGTLTTAAQNNITSVGTLTSLDVTGNVTGGNLITVGSVTSGSQYITGNVDITGNINVTGNLNYDNVTDLSVGDPLVYMGTNNSGNVYDLGFVVHWIDSKYQHGGFVRDASDGTWKLFGNVVQEPTTVVDFTDAIYQPILVGPITATTGSFSGNVSTGNVSGATGTFTNVVGTLTTASQPNITSVGTLGSLSVTGNIQGGNLQTAGLISATGAITGSQFNGSGAGLTSIPGANVTGTVANATYATSAGSATTATTAGTVTTAAQANITSVGTLTSLTTSGNIAIGTDLTNAAITANGKMLVGDSITNANLANVVDFASTSGASGFRPINLVDTSAVVKIVRLDDATNGPGVELQQWDTTISTQASYWDMYTTSSGFGIRDRKGTARDRLVIDNSGRVLIGSNVGITSSSANLIADVANLNLQVLGSAYVSGNIGVGTSDISAPFTLAYTAGTPNANLMTSDAAIITANATAPGFSFVVAANSSSGHRGVFKGTRARGTLETPLVPLENDAVVTLLGSIYDGNVTRATAGIEMTVDGAVSDGIAPQRIAMLTGNTNTRIERVSIYSNGVVNVRSTTSSTDSTTGALVVSGGLGVAVDINAGGNIVGGNLSGTNVTGTLTTAAQPNVTSVGTLTSLTVSGNATFDSGTLFVDATNNRVGIGNAAPSSPLVASAPNTTNVSLTWNAGSGQILRNENSEFAFGLEDTAPFPLYIQGRTNLNAARNIILNPLGGNIGIANLSPAHTFAVTGTGYFSGNITADYFLGNGSQLTGVTASPGGNTGEIQYNSAGTLEGSSNFTFDGTNVAMLGNVSLSVGNASTTAKFEVSGDNGQLFTVTDSMSGTIYSVNDISGIPSIEVLDSGLIKLAEYSGNVMVGTGTDAGYKFYVNGSFAATTKSFVIDHPTKPGMSLRYACLEGPENGVYTRGRSQQKVIELPDYWTGLVDESTISVTLTPHGGYQQLFVKSVGHNRIIVGTDTPETPLDYSYTVWAERKDVPPLVVEY